MAVQREGSILAELARVKERVDIVNRETLFIAMRRRWWELAEEGWRDFVGDGSTVVARTVVARTLGPDDSVSVAGRGNATTSRMDRDVQRWLEQLRLNDKEGRSRRSRSRAERTSTGDDSRSRDRSRSRSRTRAVSRSTTARSRR